MNLLHIDSSALGTHSVSRQLTAAIVEHWQRTHPGVRVHHRDVGAQPLSHWAPVADASDPAVRDGNEALDEFLAADVIVIGAPMYNFGISSQLKAWIDRILVAGKTFKYGENGPVGLVSDKKAIVASTRGGIYNDKPQMDFQEAYLRHALSFIGVTDIEFVRAEGLNMGPDNKAAAIDAAQESIRGLQRKAA